MIRVENHLGVIEISHDYFSKLIGHAVSECFGVSGMVATSPSQEINSFVFRRDSIDKGVRVRSSGGKLYIDLHIAVSYGLNIAEIVKSIINKVRYVVEDTTNLKVEKVNVYVDTMKVANSDA